MAEDRKSMPAYAGLLGGATRILGLIDDLAPGATGALRFGSDGIVLVEARRVCWAVAVGMERRLTELLRQQRSPPLAPEALEQLVDGCRRTGTPVGEALLASGQVTEAGLRTALFRQTAEAIVHIAQSGASFDGFVPHMRDRYDARFVFPTADLLSRIGAHRRAAVAAAARQELDEVLIPETMGLAFVSEPAEPEPIIVASALPEAFRVHDALDLCRWALGLFAASDVLASRPRIATADWRGAGSVVTWRDDATVNVALCSSRAASVLLLNRVMAVVKNGSDGEDR